MDLLLLLLRIAIGQDKINFKVDIFSKRFLKEQIKAIQKELGGDNQKEAEVKSYKKRLKAKKEFFDDLPKSAFALTNADDKNAEARHAR